jgi:hypothetical protein
MNHASIRSLALALALAAVTATFTLGCSEADGGARPAAGTTPAKPATAPAPMTLTAQVVEASCGECQFGMPGSGCNLAVRVGEQAWFVDGTGINDHGDSHAGDGFCNAIRKARVSGSVRGGRLGVSSFELVE